MDADVAVSSNTSVREEDEEKVEEEGNLELRPAGKRSKRDNNALLITLGVEQKSNREHVLKACCDTKVGTTMLTTTLFYGFL